MQKKVQVQSKLSNIHKYFFLLIARQKALIIGILLVYVQDKQKQVNNQKRTVPPIPKNPQMFKNKKYFFRNPQYDRTYVRNLNKLARSSALVEKMQEEISKREKTMGMEKEKAEAGNGEDEIHTADQSQNGKDGAEGIILPGWAMPVMSYMLFLRRVLGTCEDLGNGVEEEDLPEFDISFIKDCKRAKYLSMGQLIVRQCLELCSRAIFQLFQSNLSPKICLYYIFSTVRSQIWYQVRPNQKLFVVCQQLLLGLVREKMARIIKPTQEQVMREKARKIRKGRKEEIEGCWESGMGLEEVD